MQSLQYLNSEVTFAELIFKEICGELVELIIKDRNEVHYQFL